MTTMIYVLIGVAVLIAAIIAISKYSAGKAALRNRYLHIFNAFRDVHLTIVQRGTIDMEELREFALGMGEKDVLFKNDKAMLNFIDEYYKKCADLNRKGERLKTAESKDDIALMESDRKKMIDWFRQQTDGIKQRFEKYLVT